jgi:hypothetical protein
LICLFIIFHHRADRLKLLFPSSRELARDRNICRLLARLFERFFPSDKEIVGTAAKRRVAGSEYLLPRRFSWRLCFCLKQMHYQCSDCVRSRHGIKQSYLVMSKKIVEKLQSASPINASRTDRNCLRAQADRPLFTVTL